MDGSQVIHNNQNSHSQIRIDVDIIHDIGKLSGVKTTDAESNRKKLIEELKSCLKISNDEILILKLWCHNNIQANAALMELQDKNMIRKLKLHLQSCSDFYTFPDNYISIQHSGQKRAHPEDSPNKQNNNNNGNSTNNKQPQYTF